MIKRLIYFDTSSINYINDFVKTTELRKLRIRLQKEFNGIPCISPLNLYEILNTTDVVKKDELIMTCQKFFTKKIYPSPCEMLYNYVQKSTPLIERRRFKLASNSQISIVWNEIHSNHKKTINIDLTGMKDSRKKFYKQSEVLYLAINNNFETNTSDKDYMDLITAINELYYKLLPFILENYTIDSEKELFYKTNIFFIFLVFFFMDTFFNAVSDFWAKQKIFLPQLQIEHILNNFKPLLFRGPTVLMSLMAINQAKYKYERGFLLDCLHAGYYSYCDYFVSNDDHFKNFGETVSDKLSNKIISIGGFV